TTQTAQKSVGKRPTCQNITFNPVHTDGPYIAMSFDDGPSATLTPKLLDLLAARHIKATFFVIGENVMEHPEIVARAAREGHEIAIIVGRIRILRRCRRTACTSSCGGRTTQLETPPASAPL